jgi:hypothetical protein
MPAFSKPSPISVDNRLLQRRVYRKIPKQMDAVTARIPSNFTLEVALINRWPSSHSAAPLARSRTRNSLARPPVCR